MKAYKLWLKRFYENHQGNYHFNPDAKIGWRGALGWFYDKLDHSIEHKELKDLIEKELEEE